MRGIIRPLRHVYKEMFEVVDTRAIWRQAST